jgi:hypothetical protein
MDIQKIPQLVADPGAIVHCDAPFVIHVDPHQPSRLHFQAFHQNQFHPFGGEKRLRQLPDLFFMGFHQNIPSLGKKKWA